MCGGDLFLPPHNSRGKSRAKHNKIQNGWIPGVLLNSVGIVGAGEEVELLRVDVAWCVWVSITLFSVQNVRFFFS